MDLFYKDSINNLSICWEKLIDDIISSRTYNPYCYTEDYYKVFKHIVTSLIIEEEIILLDSDFTNEELVKLTGFSKFDTFNLRLIKESFSFITEKSNLLGLLKKPKHNWKITIFTSGTTGLPKKVSHSFESISRYIKISKGKSSDIWGFAYNPTHIAGIQVFFQALLNGNTIVRLLGLTNEQVFTEIENCKITNISATPTFYRLLLPHNESYPSVLRITSGGEKFDINVINQLKQIFPCAKITNIYASTEAGALFASDKDIFSIKKEMRNLVRIKKNELIVHKSLLGFFSFESGEWYHTGDLVKIISNNPLKFRFTARKNEMINVGGYKVNPNEVEEIIRGIPGIKDAIIFSKKNSVVGNIICCEMIRNDNKLEEATIRKYLQSRLQNYKIPRMILFADELSTTRTGKVKRYS